MKAPRQPRKQWTAKNIWTNDEWDLDTGELLNYESKEDKKKADDLIREYEKKQSDNDSFGLFILIAFIAVIRYLIKII